MELRDGGCAAGGGASRLATAWRPEGECREGEEACLVVWGKNWRWIWDERLVKCEEIEDKIVKLMEDENLWSMAKKIGKELKKLKERSLEITSLPLHSPKVGCPIAPEDQNG